MISTVNMRIVSLDLSFGNGAAMLMVAGLALYIAASALAFPKSEQTASLFLVRWLHFSANLFVLLYPFVFNRRYDGLFLCIWLALGASWIIMRNECLLTYVEKKLLNPDYDLGATPSEHPYMQHIFRRADGSEPASSLILPIGMHAVLLYVAVRFALVGRSKLPRAARIALILAVAGHVTYTVSCIVIAYIDKRQSINRSRGSAR